MIETPLFSFGVITDVQYCEAEPAYGRYFRNSIDKLQEALTIFNQQPLAFILDLGDLIDRYYVSFDTVTRLYQSAKAPVHFTVGNHDYSIESERKPEVTRIMGLNQEGYYAFTHAYWRFIILNGSELSLFATSEDTEQRQHSLALLGQLKQKNAVHAQEWNGGMGEQQKEWLYNALTTAQAQQQQVIVAGHYPLYPRKQHNLWNDEEVIAILEQFPQVVAYFNGHDHAGSYACKKGIHYLNFKGMVETESENAFAVVKVFDSRLEVQGFGREESRLLPIKNP